VLNNDFPSLNATVGFYINNQLFQTVDLKELKKEEARQVSVEWKPEQGKYSVAVAFIKAEAVDENGKNVDIEPSALGSVPGFGLEIPSSASSSPSAYSSPSEDVLVEKTDNGILIKKSLSSSDKVKDKLGEVVDGVSKQAEGVVDDAKNYVIEKSADAISGVVSNAGNFLKSSLPTQWQKRFDYIKNGFLSFWKEQTNGDPYREKMVAGYLLGMIILVVGFVWYWVFRKRRKDDFED